jgi:hypothetical protein
MKTILFLSTILFTTLAQAAPVVGDYVRYKMTSVAYGQSQTMEQKIQVTAIDQSAGTYTTLVSLIYAGNVISSTEETSDLISATESENSLDHCAEMPADIANIETITVPAGTFKVCHIKTEQNGIKMDQYLGKVLFGLVKSSVVDTTNNTSVVFELLEVKKN